MDKYDICSWVQGRRDRVEVCQPERAFLRLGGRQGRKFRSQVVWAVRAPGSARAR